MRTMVLFLLAGQLGAATNKLNPPIPANPVYLTAPAQAQIWVGGSAVSTTNPVPVTAPLSGSLPVRVTAPVAVVPTDSAGNAYESTNPFNDHYYLGVATVQDVHASTLNASTTPLAASASFTGTAETSLGVSGIQVSCYSNETITVRVQQSADGVGWWWEDSFTSFALTGESRTFQATSNYYRVIANNTGAATTQTFTVQTALCPMVEAVPRSLSADGSFKVSLQSFKARTDKVIHSITTTAVAPIIVIPAQGDRVYTDLSSIHLSNQSNAATVVRVYDGAANTVIAFNLAAGADKDVVWGTALVPQSLPNKPWSIQTTVTPGGAGGLFRATMYGYRVKQ